MGKVKEELEKIWIAAGHKPVMAGSDWCDDWKKKHPVNCVGCPQEENCGDFAKMISEIIRGKDK